MQYWLLKSEPDVWSIDQQRKAGSKGVSWDGVRNYQAANNLKKISKKMNFRCIFPSKEFCGDNAAMIAWAGIQRFKKKLYKKENGIVKSRWPLDRNAPFLKGPGLKL